MTDLRLALRQFRKSPGFTFIAVLTLALTIGATTAVFSLVQAVLLRPSSYPNADRIAVLRTAHLPELADFNASPGDFLSWKDELKSFETLGALAEQNFILTSSGEPRQIAGARISAETFAVLGLAPELGRGFEQKEDASGANAVAVISHDFWLQQFGGAANALGQTLRLDGRAYTIVGVMPREFLREKRSSIWVPMAFSDAERSDNYRGARFIDVLGRLRQGVTLEQAQAELDLVATRLAQKHPSFNRGWTVSATVHKDYAVRRVRTLLWIVLAAVGSVLAVACVNLAGLTLARGIARERELAVRASLGATRARLSRQLFTENLMLALVGGFAGCLLAKLTLGTLIALAPSNVFAAADVTIDGGVLLFVAGLSVATALVFGLLPAWRLTKVDLNSALKSQASGSGVSGAHLRMRRTLAIVQLGGAIALLACTSLLVRSLVRLSSVKPGFTPEGALVAQIDLPTSKYSSSQKQEAFARQVQEHVRALPGVSSAAYTQVLPLHGNWRVDFMIEGRPPAKDGSQKAGYFAVSPDYFSAMGIRLVRGRTFSETDTAQSPPVAIVSESFAHRHFPSGDALGRRIFLMNGPWRLSEIVGIVADVKQTSLADLAPPQAYEPFSQGARPNFSIVVRKDEKQNAPLPTVSVLRQAVLAVDPEQPITTVYPLESLISGSVSAQRFVAALLSVFALVATIIATVGIFGVMMQNVSLRTREFGLRIALGASQQQVVGGVLRQGIVLIATGALLGLGLAALCIPFVRSLLYELVPLDVLTVVLSLAVIAPFALLACWVPARRATKINPVEALKAE